MSNLQTRVEALEAGLLKREALLNHALLCLEMLFKDQALSDDHRQQLAAITKDLSEIDVINSKLNAEHRSLATMLDRIEAHGRWGNVAKSASS
jgi:hypothetical protein